MTNTGTIEDPSLFGGLMAVIRRDTLLAWKRPGDVLNPLFFFAMVSTLFPLAIGPSPEQLRFAGPGVVWVAALLASLFARSACSIIAQSMKERRASLNFAEGRV